MTGDAMIGSVALGPRRASAGAVLSDDFDQILLFEDAQKIIEKEREDAERKEREEEEEEAMEVQSVEFVPSSPTRDPIMEFVLSEEEEEEEEEVERVEVTVEDIDENGQTITLVPNQDIQIHNPPLVRI
jgi:hypothetical protein